MTDDDPIEPAATEALELVGRRQGKTTAAMKMGLRAADHGYRVQVLQLMQGGTGTVEDVRGEYNASPRGVPIDAGPM